MNWGSELMSKISMNDGWLIYAGRMGLIAADVRHAEMSAYASAIDITSINSPYRQTVRGPIDVTFTAQLDGKYQWDRSPNGDEPVNLAALLALARRHREEYDRLCEGEAILKALGG